MNEQKNHPRPRVGKTQRDHESGAWASRFSNQKAREAWQKDRAATNATFPGHGRP